MLKITGKLVFIKEVARKENADYTTDAHQKLQVQVLDEEKGYTLLDIKDTSYKFSKSDLNKDVTIPVTAFSSQNIYYKVA